MRGGQGIDIVGLDKGWSESGEGSFSPIIYSPHSTLPLLTHTFSPHPTPSYPTLLTHSLPSSPTYPSPTPPGDPPDVLIVESTFGVITLPPKEERESRFTTTVEEIVTRGGSCLIPVFALGRAQELLLILDEYWQEHPELQGVPVFYASKLASKVGG